MVFTLQTDDVPMTMTDVPMAPYQINSDFWTLTRHRQALIWAKMAAPWNSEPLAKVMQGALIFRSLKLSAPQ